MERIDLTTKPHVLQIGCVPGDFSVELAKKLRSNGSLTIIDPVPAQVENVKLKTRVFSHVQVLQESGERTSFPEGYLDVVILFFLLHELPPSIQEKVVKEVHRVLKKDGKLLLVDYHRPPNILFRSTICLPFRILEPYIHEVWEKDFNSWLPSLGFKKVEKETHFFGLYQIIEASDK